MFQKFCNITFFTYSVFTRNATILLALVDRTGQLPYDTRVFVAAGHLSFHLEGPISNTRLAADTEVADLVARPKTYNILY